MGPPIGRRCQVSNPLIKRNPPNFINFRPAEVFNGSSIKSMDVLGFSQFLHLEPPFEKDFNKNFTFSRQADKPMKLLTFGKTKHEGGWKMIFFFLILGDF